MRKIEIDDDIYDFLVRNTQEIGETASSILRRLLNIRSLSDPKKPSADGECSDGPRAFAAALFQPDGSDARHPLLSCLAHQGFESQRSAVSRFLTLLSALHEVHRNDFHKVLNLGGRERTYFAMSAAEIQKAGSSTHPQKIPGTLYWVVTNNDTPKKQRMAEDVLRVLGYEEDEAHKIAQLIDPGVGAEMNRFLRNLRGPIATKPGEVSI